LFATRRRIQVMDWKTLNAGKHAAEELAPDPSEHTPEAPIISEEEAQVVESPDGAAPDPAPENIPSDDVRRQAGTTGKNDGIRITPDDNDR
jgi:hypothetical protein